MVDSVPVKDHGLEAASFSMSDAINSFWTVGEVSSNVVGAFAVSFVALILFSILKFRINGGFSKNELGNLLLEFPIDLSAAITTLLATLYRRMDPYVYMTIILLSIVVACLCCAIRQNAIKAMDTHSHKGYAFLGILSLLIVVFWIWLLIHIIF